MDIRDPSWQRRYERTGFELHPAIERFGYRELELLDKSWLNGFLELHPKIERELQDVRARVVDPLADMLTWGYNAELLKSQYEDSLHFRRQIETTAREQGLPELLVDFEDYFTIADEMAQNFGNVEANFSQYQEFLKNLMASIISRVQNTRVRIPDSSLILDDKSIRDDIYRSVIPSDATWLLGWGIYFLPQTMATTQKLFEYKKGIYTEVKEQHVEGIPIPQKEISMLLPNLLGNINVSAKTVFEGLADRLPQSEELYELSVGLRDYFSKRAEQVFK